MRSAIRHLLLPAFTLVSVTIAFGQTYTIKDIGLLPGYAHSYAFDINESGRVIGLASDSGAFYADCDPESTNGQGFISDNGAVTKLPGDSTRGVKLNASGTVVGRISSSDVWGPLSRPAIFSGSVAKDVLPSFESSGFPTEGTRLEGATYGISDSGLVGGNALFDRYPFVYKSGTALYLSDTRQPVSSGKIRGVNNKNEILLLLKTSYYKLSGALTIYTPSDDAPSRKAYKFENLDVLPPIPQDANYTKAYALNDAGEFVGYFSNVNGYRYFVYSGSMYSDIPPPSGEKIVMPYDLNNKRHIVGCSIDAQKSYRAFVNSGTESFDLNNHTTGLVPNGTAVGFTELLCAFGINEADQIVGVGRWRNEKGELGLRGFILTPSQSFERVAAPTMSPAGGSYNGYVRVDIHCATPGATILYSTDDTPPTKQTSGGFMYLTESCHLRLIATKTGLRDSLETSAPFSITPPTESTKGITFSPNGGDYVDEVSVTISTETPGCIILVTTDGSDPREAAQHSGTPTTTFKVTKDCKIRAVARKMGYLDSEAVSQPFRFIYSTPLDPPVITPDSREFLGAVTVSISSNEPDTAIYCRADGLFEWRLYEGPFTVNRNSTVMAYAAPTNVNASSPKANSRIVEAHFQTSAPISAQVSIQPSGGSFAGSQLVTLSTKEKKGAIFYTLDGSEPTPDSLVYEAPFFLSESATLKARTIKPGSNYSDLATAVFEIASSSQAVANPIISKPGGAYSKGFSANVKTATPKASLRYTLDGSIPSGSSPEMKGGIKIDRSCTLTVRAFKNGLNPSAPAAAAYTFTAPVKTSR